MFQPVGKAWFRCALPLLFGLLVAQGVSAQVVSKHLWVNGNLDFRFSDRWGVRAEAHIRREGMVEHWQQLILRPAVIYYLNPRWTFILGASYIQDHPWKGGVHGWTPIRETWQDATVSFNWGRVVFQQKFLLEQRWVGRPIYEPGADRATWVYLNRLRLRLTAMIPLSRPRIEKGTFFGVLANEVKLTLSDEGPANNGFTRNRFMVMLGYQYHPSGNIQVGYNWQLVDARPLAPLENNHVLRIAVSQTLDLR